MNQPAMLPCDQVIAQLWAFIDGELTPETTRRLEEHLELCQRCLPQYDFQRAFVAFISRQREQPVPAGLRAAVFQSLLDEESKPKSLLRRLFTRE
jgi:anti-sigma factor (TIGR02949 family)